MSKKVMLITGILILTGAAVGLAAFQNHNIDLQGEKSKPVMETARQSDSLHLKFSQIENNQSIKAESKIPSVKMIDRIKLDSGEAYIYEKAGDPGNLYGGFSNKDKYFNLGTIGDKANLEGGLTYVRAMTLYDKSVIKFQGVAGSHVSLTNYYILDQGVPKPFLATEGVTTEMDLDGDGVKEIVAELPGTIPSVNLFKREGSSFSYVSVDQALEAKSAIFNSEDGSFIAYKMIDSHENPTGTAYCYSENGMVSKTRLQDVVDVLSENVVHLNKDTKNKKLIVKMAEGKKYEDPAAGPFQGWNWQGRFVVKLLDGDGKVLSEINLNKAFNEEELRFSRTFTIQFEDYNGDGNPDFTIGQYGSSNGNHYRLFTIRNDKVELLPVKTGSIFSSGGRSRYTIDYMKAGRESFLNSYYDNSKGKEIRQLFTWDGTQFINKAINP